MNEKTGAPIEMMDCMIWNHDTHPSRTRTYDIRPIVTISPSSGRISFNGVASKMLGLADVHGVEFVQTGRKQDEWYVTTSSRPSAYRAVRSKGSYGFCSQKLAAAITACVTRKSNTPSYRIQLDTKPTEFMDRRAGSEGIVTAYALITISAQDIERKGGKR